jgi:hypothetical protein
MKYRIASDRHTEAFGDFEGHELIAELPELKLQAEQGNAWRLQELSATRLLN